MAYCALHRRDEVLMCEPRRLSNAIGAIGGYVPRDIGRGNVASAITYTTRLVEYGTRLLALIRAPLDYRPVPLVQTGGTAGVVSGWTYRDETVDGINASWVEPSEVRRPGVVVTIPGGPGESWKAYAGAHEIARMLGVRVLAWDARDRSPEGVPTPGQAVADIRAGVGLARSRYPGRVVLVAHSFSGLFAAEAALNGLPNPDAYVAVSSVLNLDGIGPSDRPLFEAASIDGRGYARRIPVTVIAGQLDIPSCLPAMSRPWAQAYADVGGPVRMYEVLGAGHSVTLSSTTLIEEIARHLVGGSR